MLTTHYKNINISKNRAYEEKNISNLAIVRLTIAKFEMFFFLVGSSFWDIGVQNLTKLITIFNGICYRISFSPYAKDSTK